MGGGSSSNAKNSKEKVKEEENEEKKSENKKDEESEDNEESEESDENESLEKIKEEEDEAEDEEDEKKKKKTIRSKGKSKDKKNSKEVKETKSKKSIKITKDVSKKKKIEDGFFSVEEPSSNKQSDINSSNKNNDININLSEKSSFIDTRKYNTNSSFNSSQSKNLKNSKNSNDIKNDENSEISKNSSILDPPKAIDYNNKRADNRIFGEFNYTNMDKIYEEEQEEDVINQNQNNTESVETETYKELTFKEKIEDEYQRHKNYLDTNEKGVYAKINKKSYKNAKRYKYRKSLLLHEKEITSICTLSGTIKKIVYATSSVDKSIKFWNSKFLEINHINNLEWYSNFLCEFDTTNILSSESIYIKMYDLMSDNIECIRTFRDHIEDINAILPLINFDEEKFFFITGGKDKILRLWDHDIDTPMKYYEGHYDVVTHIQKIGLDNKKIISCSKDKTFIVWDLQNTNPIKIFNNYFNHLYLLGNKIGFCCGAYDNKIRFYDIDYLLNKCLITEFHGINNILMIDDYYMLIVDINNSINVLDLYENNFVFSYTGCADEVVNVIKSHNWDLDNTENKIIIVTCKDGYIYLYSFELVINSKNNSKKKSSKKGKEKNKKDKNQKDKIKKDKDKKDKKEK